MRKRNYREKDSKKEPINWEKLTPPQPELLPTVFPEYWNKLSFAFTQAGLDYKIQTKLLPHVLKIESILGKFLFQTATIQTLAQARIAFLVYARKGGLARLLAESKHFQSFFSGTRRKTASQMITWYVQQEAFQRDYLGTISFWEILRIEGKTEEEYIRTSKMLGLNPAAQEAMLSGNASIYDLLHLQPELFFIIPLVGK